MIIKEIVDYFNGIAPDALQEDYDNSGLQVGDPDGEVKGALVCVDCTEEVIDEAIRDSIGLIISHHPLIFSGLRKLVGADHVQRIVQKAIQNNIALYAIHTNLDNVLHGVNGRFAEILGITAERVLRPKKGQLLKLAIHVPSGSYEIVRNALFSAGAGQIGNYSECSFGYEGTGSFKPEAGSDPTAGDIGVRHEEIERKLEVIVESWKSMEVLRAMQDAHPYEEVAYDLIPLVNEHLQVGSGIIGSLPTRISEEEFLVMVKERLNCRILRHSAITGKPIQRVAICGGSGGFLIADAMRQGVDAFITADLKYHQFQEPDGRMLLVDAGHYETECATMSLIADLVAEKFPKFALRLTRTDSNPIHYV